MWAVRHFRTYLYGHHCVVYKDHAALKSLLNTPQPSDKLARWGMALQEMDLTIVHRSARRNTNADALSRFPLPTSADENPTCGVVATLTAEPTEENDLASEQRSDEGLAAIITYIETGVLPEEEKLAKQVALTSPLYTVQNRVLYRKRCHTSGGAPQCISPVACTKKHTQGNLVLT